MKWGIVMTGLYVFWCFDALALFVLGLSEKPRRATPALREVDGQSKEFEDTKNAA